MFRFIIQLTAAALLVLIGSWLIVDLYLNRAFPASLIISIVFLYLLQVAIHLFLLRATKGRPQRFVSYYMGATGLKFFAVIACLTLVGLFDNENLMITGVAFALAYLVFLALEVPALLSAMRSNDQENDASANNDKR